MYRIQLGKSDLQVPTIGVGCFRMSALSVKEAEAFIDKALELEMNFFDHADIYGGGECETLFAEAIGMNATVREKVILQSKCGIVPGKRYDFSKDYILQSVDGILKRLNTDYLDVLLLHRPDALVEPEEVAEAFDALKISGKVRHFGMSNQNTKQIQLLQKYVKQPIVANQLQLSPTNATMIQQGLEVNMGSDGAVNRDGSILDFCRLQDITIQPWSPFQFGFMEGVYLDNEKFPELNRVINTLAKQYKVTNIAIVVAWILRHPARLQPILGTMNKERLEEASKACDIRLTRQEWYDIYLAAGHFLP